MIMNIVQTPNGYPIRVLQFGEGNFLRAFADWMIQQMNDKAGFNASVMMVSPRGNAESCARVNAQHGQYHLVERGINSVGEIVDSIEPITCVAGCLNPFADYELLLQIITSPELRFVISNTTEAGLVYKEHDWKSGTIPSSYPALLTALLFARFQERLPGLVITPFELLERNGQLLREIILRHAKDAGYPDIFFDWLEKDNFFGDTLVDRIVSGKPQDADEIQRKNGFVDNMLVVAEPFHFLAITLPEAVRNEIPFAKAGLNVAITDDIGPYRERKVRLLNGTHTGMVASGLLADVKFVADMLNDADFGKFVKKLIFTELLPVVPLPDEEKRAFANAVLIRFSNPFAYHKLESISLNSASKWLVRDYPAVARNLEQGNHNIPCLAFSLAALMEYYTAGNGQDTPSILEYFTSHPDIVDTEDVLSHTIFAGGEKLPEDFVAMVCAQREMIRANGARNAVRELLAR